MKDFKPASPIYYSANITGLVPPASSTETITLYGSPSKIVKIWSINLSGFAGTGITVPISLLLKSSITTGTTFTALTIGKFDINAPASTITNYRGYTAVPGTIGSTGATLQSQYLTLGATTLAEQSTSILCGFSFTMVPITLHNPNQGLSITMNTTSVSSGSMACTIIYSEE